MSKEVAVIALGFLIIVLTQLGIPSSARTVLIVLCALGLIGIGFFLRAEALSRGGKRTPHHPFVESGHPQESAHEENSRNLVS
jgi:hypothetical protein